MAPPQPATAIDRGEPPHSVLFACNLNAIRSPMAAAIANHLFGHRLHAESAGVRAGELNPFAVAAMAEIGIDIADHMPRSFDDLEGRTFDLVISLTPEAQHRAVELTRNMDCQIEYWPTFDPTAVHGSREIILDAYRQVRDTLMARIDARFRDLPPPTV